VIPSNKSKPTNNHSTQIALDLNSTMAAAPSPADCSAKKCNYTRRFTPHLGDVLVGDMQKFQGKVFIFCLQTKDLANTRHGLTSIPLPIMVSSSTCPTAIFRPILPPPPAASRVHRWPVMDEKRR
jgi:hypothetical protein